MSIAMPFTVISVASLAFGIASIAWAIRARSDAARIASSALIDPLTGVFNRRGWDMLVARESARAMRDATTLAVFFMDVDDFKTINDRYGHAAGDKALVQIASDIRSAARAQDVIARMGGDEFAVLAIDDGTGFSPESLLARWASMFAVSKMRVSVGYALSANGDVADALERADAEMYCVKRRSRIERAQSVHDGASPIAATSKRSLRV